MATLISPLSPAPENTVEQPTRILVVEDEPNVAEVVEKYLRREGFEAAVVHDGNSAVDHMAREGADLVILDLMLPGLDGLEVCRRMRADADPTPIIMLTAKDAESDVVLGLGLGADDHMGKPFSPAELVARVKAILRRGTATQVATGPVLRAGSLRISSETRTTMRGDEELTLTAKEFDLLHFLASHPAQVFSREQLLDSVWDYEYPGDTSTVTVHIRRLRSKIEVDPERPRHIKTVWGVGYKFDM
jgi:DNA-binding response OmpR family regulator